MPPSHHESDTISHLGPTKAAPHRESPKKQFLIRQTDNEIENKLSFEQTISHVANKLKDDTREVFLTIGYLVMFGNSITEEKRGNSIRQEAITRHGFVGREYDAHIYHIKKELTKVYGSH